MPDAIAIRPARPADAEAIARLIHAHAVEEGAASYVTATAQGIAREAFGPSPSVEILVAERAGRIVGQLLFLHVFSSWKGEKFLTIEDLYLLPEVRGLKLGERLLQEVARICRARGAPRIDLVVDADNAGAKRFYRRLGFKHLDSWQHYRLDGESLDRLGG